MTADVFKRFARRKVSVVCAVILLLFLLMALVGPYLCRYDPNLQDIANKYQPPSMEHLLGTDNLGRDMLSRMIYGARVSLLVSFVVPSWALSSARPWVSWRDTTANGWIP